MVMPNVNDRMKSFWVKAANSSAGLFFLKKTLKNKSRLLNILPPKKKGNGEDRGKICHSHLNETLSFEYDATVLCKHSMNVKHGQKLSVSRDLQDSTHKHPLLFRILGAFPIKLKIITSLYQPKEMPFF